MTNSAIKEVERKQRRRLRIPAVGLFESMKVTLRAMLTRAVTVHYPEERVELPPRTRGVIALLEENCTVCMLCAKECPCWCIYIEGHKEQLPGKRKAVNVLDRFAIDFGLCMYCGICVEVCPFDALHWSPAFEYTSFTYEGMVHESDVLKAWQYQVLPPPELVDDADEANKTATLEARAKRAEGIHAVIREADKREAFIEAELQAREPEYVPVSPYPPAGGGVAFVEPTNGVAAGAAPAAAAPVASAAPAPAAEAPASAPGAPASTAPDQSTAATPGAATPSAAASAGDTFGLPKIDVMKLPDGIGPVERGRLKKLAIFQERGTKPSDELIANLKHLLDKL